MCPQTKNTDMGALDIKRLISKTRICVLNKYQHIWLISVTDILMEFKILFALTSSCGLFKKLKSPRVKAI